MADLGLRRRRERWGEEGDECGVKSQNSRTGRDTKAGCDFSPRRCRGTSRRTRAPGGTAEAGGILVARLLWRMSHECGELRGVLVGGRAALTVHAARG